MTERRYVMTKVDAGDYLLPSNDGDTIWRLRRYEEDGSATRADGTVVLGVRWELLSFDGARWELENDPGLVYEMDRWRCVAINLRTRAAAIRQAISP